MGRILSIVGGVIVFIIAIVFILSLFGFKIPFFMQTKTLHVKDQTFTVEIATSTGEKQKGLSNRKKLADDHGMLFVFDKPDYQRFWMKEMQFPLDIIFINDNKIVTIYQNVPVPTNTTLPLPIYTSTVPSDKVLEINAGLVNKYAIKEGDSITIDL